MYIYISSSTSASARGEGSSPAAPQVERNHPSTHANIPLQPNDAFEGEPNEPPRIPIEQATVARGESRIWKRNQQEKQNRARAKQVLQQITHGKLSAERGSQLLVETGHACLPVLRKSVLRHKHLNTRVAAAHALGALGDAQALHPLGRAALKDSVRDVRAAAAKALGALGDVQALPLLGKALQDPDWSVRAAAASALGTLGSAS